MSSTISSPDDVMRLLFNLTRFEMQSSKFIEESVLRIATEEILVPIKSKMKAENYSQKIIDGTSIENIFVDSGGFVQFDVVSEYNADNGFDVAKAREEGTRDHFIRTRLKKALKWPAPSGGNVFDKGHEVSGIKKTNIIKDTTREKFPIVQQRLTQEVVQFYNTLVIT